MRFFYSWMIIAGVVLCSAGATNAASSDIVKKVQSRYGSVTQASAEFDVEIFWAVREKTEKKSGSFVFAPGDRFRIVLPTAEYVGNGTSVWFYNKGAKQVIVDRAGSVDPASLPSAVIGRCLSYAYSVKAIKGGVTELVADSAGAQQNGFSAVTLFVDAASGSIKKIATVDRSGNTSTYILKKFLVGPAAKLPSFSFTIPKGVDVVDKTK